MVSPEVVARLDAWLAALPQGVEEFVSAMSLAVPRLVVAPRGLAAKVAEIAHGKLLSGQASDPAALDANYVRQSDAELFWKE